MEIEIGSVVEGTVTAVTGFGAFVDLPNGRKGLVHISEIAPYFVENIRDYVKENERVKVKVLRLDHQGRYELSMKRAIDGGNERGSRESKAKDSKRFPADTSSVKQADIPFEDKLSRFMKESEERLLDLKRNTENKRGKSRPR